MGECCRWSCLAVSTQGRTNPLCACEYEFACEYARTPSKGFSAFQLSPVHHRHLEKILTPATPACGVSSRVWGYGVVR